MKKAVLKISMCIVGLVVMVGFFWGCYWVSKTVSYSLFYESMVEETVVDMVKPEYLK